jgi:hypothetical protein
MSQPDEPRTNAAAGPFPPKQEQELWTQAQIEEAFAQNSSDEPFLALTFDDGLQAASFTYDSSSVLKADSSDPSTVSTPDFSGYSFSQESPAFTLSGTSTPHLYPLEQQQAYQVNHEYTSQNRPLPLRAHTNSTFVFLTPSLHSHDRRRSLSHGDVDRIAAAPSHPTFVRLQGGQGSRPTSPAFDDERRSGFFPGHSRSRSHGPRGRPLQNAVPIQLFGTHIGTSLHEPKDKKASKSRKRVHKDDDDGETSPKFQDPLVRNMTDPAQLAHSRRIIEIGAMAVRNHSKIDAALEDKDHLSPLERIMKKLEDVEQYLQRDEAKNAEALKGCAMIREALKQRARSIDAAVNMDEGVGNADQDALEAPSKIMAEDDLGLFGGVLDDNDLMSLLMRENDQLGGEVDGT